MFKQLTLVFLALALTRSEVLEFDNSVIEKVFQNSNPALFLFVQTEAEATEAALTALKEYETQSPEGLVVTVSASEDGHGLFERLAEYLGVDISATPVVLYMGDKNDKYRYNAEEITVDNLSAFVAGVQSGEIEQFLKSAEIPEENNDAVKVLVGKNFKSVVMESEKEFLVKFYAPWCGHCKTLAPLYEEAAKLLEANENIVLAKVDSTENEVAGIDIQGFPTLKFFPKDKTQEPIEYDGGRDTEGILSWLK